MTVLRGSIKYPHRRIFDEHRYGTYWETIEFVERRSQRSGIEVSLDIGFEYVVYL